MKKFMKWYMKLTVWANGITVLIVWFIGMIVKAGLITGKLLDWLELYNAVIVRTCVGNTKKQLEDIKL